MLIRLLSLTCMDSSSHSCFINILDLCLPFLPRSHLPALSQVFSHVLKRSQATFICIILKRLFPECHQFLTLSTQLFHVIPQWHQISIASTCFLSYWVILHISEHHNATGLRHDRRILFHITTKQYLSRRVATMSAFATKSTHSADVWRKCVI